MYKVDLEKAEEPEIKMPIFVGSQKKPGNSRKISASLTTLNALTVDHNKLWEILKKMGIADHHTCLMQNLYAGQEASQNWTWNKLRLVPNWEKGYVKAVYCHPAYLTSMQSTS